MRRAKVPLPPATRRGGRRGCGAAGRARLLPVLLGLGTSAKSFFR